MKVIAASRILMIRIEPAPYTLALTHALQEQWLSQIDVCFVSTGASQPWQSDLPGRDLNVLPAGRLKAIGQVWEMIERHRPGILHVAGWNDPVVRAATFAAAWRGIPVVSELDTWRDQASGLKWLLKRTMLPAYATLVSGFAAGGSRQRQFLESYGVPARKIVTVNMTVDVAALRRIDRTDRLAARQAFRNDIGVEANAPLALYLGRLTSEKGIDILLEAWRIVVSGMSEARLVIVGDGELAALVRSSAEKDSSIRAVGRLNSNTVWRAYSAADLFIGPSRFEQWGLAVNEAMALDLSVAVTDAFGCVGDLVEHERTGLVAIAENPAALARTILRALCDDALRRTLAQRASERIADWTIEAQAGKICTLWQQTRRLRCAHAAK